MSNKPKVALVVPALNEGKAIGGVVKNLQKAFQGSDYQAQIIVIDDGSKDDTAEQARSSGAYVISHIINTGQGGAFATGLDYARKHGFDIAATSDADGQHDAKDVLRGVKLIEKSNSDLLIGSRLINGREMTLIKRVGNRGLSLVTFVLFGVNVADSQSGLRIFSRRALEELQWKTNGYEVCSEMLWRAKQQKLRIDEYPIQVIYSDYSKSKGQSNWNGVNILKTLLRRRIVELFE